MEYYLGYDGAGGEGGQSPTGLRLTFDPEYRLSASAGASPTAWYAGRKNKEEVA